MEWIGVVAGNLLHPPSIYTPFLIFLSQSHFVHHLSASQVHFSIRNLEVIKLNWVWKPSTKKPNIQIMISISSAIHHPNLFSLSSSFSHQSNSKTRWLKVRASSTTQKLVITKPVVHDHKLQNRAARLAESLSNLVHLRLDSPSIKQSRRKKFISHVEQNTPTTSPKEDIATKWKEIHGSNDFQNLLEPLHPWLRREIVKYGEFSQATYDSFDFDSHSEYCGSCKYSQQRLFEKLGLSKNGYKVTKYIYAMSHVDVPHWLERSHLVDTWSKDSNWMGYVAVSDDEETKRIGRRDIVVAWRGTVAPSEWFEDLQNKLEPIGKESENKDVKVEHGFLDIYKSKSESTRYNKSSASEQVMKEIKRLVNHYQQNGEQVSLTVTGHSLGAALAVLNAYEAAETIPGLPVSVISFGGPRVGNNGFRNKLHQMGVKTLRVVVKQDLVPKMPGLMLNEGLEKFDEITGHLDWVYTHVGTELKLDIGASPYLKQGLDLSGFHSLETYLHLIDGFIGGKESQFREKARRDLALVNKSCGMLRDEMRVPECWYQLGYKGLVRNSYGRWERPSREPEDIPLSPSIENHNEMQAPSFC